MTYASQKLAEALQALVRKAERSHDYATYRPRVPIQTRDVEIPAAVAEFLESTSDYAEKTKTVSLGKY